jgi:aldehyde dehydrogenase (NAD+)
MPATQTSKYSSAVETFLSEAPHRLFIGGRWLPSRQGLTFQTVDPGAGSVLSVVHDAQKEDVDLAVQTAREAFRNSGWARMTPNARGVYLHRLADLVEKNKATLAEIESLDVGKPQPQATGDIENFSATLRYYTDLAVHVQYRTPIAVSKHEARVVRQPYGVCGFIFPWNFPFLLVGWGISPALAAGNTVVIKPAEDTPLSTLYLTKLVKEAGIPDGVVNSGDGAGNHGWTGIGESSRAEPDVLHGISRGGETRGRVLRPKSDSGEAGAGRQGCCRYFRRYRCG